MRTLLILSMLILFGAKSQAEPATAPNNDFGRPFVSCSHGFNSATFTAVIDADLASSGTGVLVSSFQPLYAYPFLNKIQYTVAKDNSITITGSGFSIAIAPKGKGTYQRTGDVDTPPSLPDDKEAAKSRGDSQTVDFNVFEPISLLCTTPFVQPIPPTGFSVGN